MTVTVDSLQKIWDLGTVEEPKVDKPIPCSKCKNAEAIVRVFWQECPCGEVPKSSLLCIKCYESYSYRKMGSTQLRAGECRSCGCTVVILRVTSIR